MNGQSLASLALSLLVVGLAAVVLRPAGLESARPPAVAEAPPIPPAAEPEKPADLARAIAPRARLTAASTIRPLASPPASDSEETIHPPGSAFTQVEPGETLALVARRVYGSSSARERLWRGNRDLLTDPEAALRSGTILRTP